MILVDTNVISEPMRPLPEPTVLRWLDRQKVERLFLASTSLAEILTGISVMPDGQRKYEMQEDVEEHVARYFSGRILPYDERAARIYARLYSDARTRGRSISMPDCQIAAIAESNGMIVATRDVKPFRGVGLRVVNPWESGA